MLSVGLPGWIKAGHYVISEQNGLKKMIHEEDAYVLVDVRPREAASAGHIKGAVSMPASELKRFKDRFPEKKTAPVILYDEKVVAKETFDLVRGWGYLNTSALRGGASAWTGRFFPGDPGTKIVYVKKLKPGQISIAEFKKLSKEMSDDIQFLDVCEYREFLLTGAMHIPQPELADRLGELPKDKEIIVHCYTGVNASMSHKILTDNGFKNRYLNAVVLIREDGTCECTEK